MIYAKYIMCRLFPVVRYVETVDCLMSVKNFNASVFISNFVWHFYPFFLHCKVEKSINIVRNICHLKEFCCIDLP